jgi:pimeloyl-ACP methyl ester carboxylesterase
LLQAGGKLAIVASIVTMLALAIVACGKSDLARTVPEGAKPNDLKLEPCTFKTKAGKYAADCGTLVVPENREKAGSRLIALPVIRIRATSGSAAAPIFWLEGGPGMSNMKFKPPAWLLAHHDVVMVGYRGADGSAVLNCPEAAEAIKGVGDNLLSAESRANFGNAFARGFARLRNEGFDLDGYNMLEVVEDMEAARAGFGYERVNLLSESYGTRIAQIYAQRHPERIQRSAMIGVNPPGRFVWSPATIDAQLQYYARLCSQDANCSQRTADLAATIRRVAQNMPSKWLFVPIDAGKVKVITFVLLFHRKTAAMVFDAYVAAEKGDPSGLALMSLAHDFVFPSQIIWGDLAAKAFSADYDSTRDYDAEVNPSNSILGSPLSFLQWSSLKNNWPMRLLPAEFRQAQPSEVETLLISGSIDFSTPAEFAAEELLPKLARGKQVILREMGHTQDVWNVQPQALEHLLTSFYDTGAADDSRFTYAPMDFKVAWGFPLLAKLLLGVVLLVAVAVAAVIWFIARRV